MVKEKCKHESYLIGVDGYGHCLECGALGLQKFMPQQSLFEGKEWRFAVEPVKGKRVKHESIRRSDG